MIQLTLNLRFINYGKLGHMNKIMKNLKQLSRKKREILHKNNLKILPIRTEIRLVVKFHENPFWSFFCANPRYGFQNFFQDFTLGF